MANREVESTDSLILAYLVSCFFLLPAPYSILLTYMEHPIVWATDATRHRVPVTQFTLLL